MVTIGQIKPAQETEEKNDQHHYSNQMWSLIVLDFAEGQIAIGQNYTPSGGDFKFNKKETFETFLKSKGKDFPQNMFKANKKLNGKEALKRLQEAEWPDINWDDLDYSDQKTTHDQVIPSDAEF